MAIKKLPNGRWEASYRDPAGRERVKHHRTRTEADRWLTTTKEQLNRGGYVDPRNGKRPLSSFASSWLESAATHVRPKTWTHYESILRIHVLPTFAQQPIAAIGPAEVRGFLTERSKAGAAPGTVRSARKVLRLVLATAQADGAIRANPCDCSRVAASPKAEMVFLTAEQVEVLATAIDERYTTLIRLAAYTGLRAGEICALRVGRVDLAAKRITIAESVTEVQGLGLHFSEPKTYERRSVTLPAFLVDELTTDLAGRPDNPEALVFTSPEGSTLNHKNFYRRHFKPALAAAGLPAEMRFHDLRHTCAALCIALGAHPKAIQERLGHSSITVTLDRYGHLFPKLDELLTEGSGRVFALSIVRWAAPRPGRDHVASLRAAAGLRDSRSPRCRRSVRAMVGHPPG